MSEAEPEDKPPEDEAPDAEPAGTASEEVPEHVPDDWLDAKPFDPAGR